MKVLNLYAGIGGNRKLWDDVEVTAVEWEPKIAAIYQDFFPDDEVIAADAHQYLLEHFNEYDFIWSSPPCPTHSKLRRNMGVEGQTLKPVFPDMKLYEEIIFLESYYKGLYCVENVISYYSPLIRPQQLGRHYLWANFLIREKNFGPSYTRKNSGFKELQKILGYELSGYSYPDKRGLLRNCVDPELGRIVLDCARGNTQLSLSEFRTKTIICAEEEKK